MTGLPRTNVDLTQKNYRVIGTVEGSASIARVCGIGDLSQKAIQKNAHSNMIKNTKPTGSQAIINTTTEMKQRGVPPLYWKTIITTHDRVIEFTEHSLFSPARACVNQARAVYFFS